MATHGSRFLPIFQASSHTLPPVRQRHPAHYVGRRAAGVRCPFRLPMSSALACTFEPTYNCTACRRGAGVGVFRQLVLRHAGQPAARADGGALPLGHRCHAALREGTQLLGWAIVSSCAVRDCRGRGGETMLRFTLMPYIRYVVMLQQRHVCSVSWVLRCAVTAGLNCLSCCRRGCCHHLLRSRGMTSQPQRCGDCCLSLCHMHSRQ